MIRIIIAVVLIYSMKLNASSLPDFPFLLSSGVAKMEVAPELVELKLTVEQFDIDSDKALSLLNRRVSALIKILDEANIVGDNITSYQVDKDIKKKRDKDYNYTQIIGYRFSQDFKIKVINIQGYPSLLEKILRLENVGRISASFDISDRDRRRNELVKIASLDAKTKAKELANNMGVKLGKVYALAQDREFGSFFAKFGLKKEDFDFGRPPPPQDSGNTESSNLFAPKSIKLYKTIHVVYKIKP